eukprot:474936_1
MVAVGNRFKSCLSTVQKQYQHSASKKRTNMEYVRLMKGAHRSLNDAFKYYDRITEPKNHFSINKLLKMCTSEGHTVTANRISNIWQDIIDTNNLQNISHELLFKACSNVLRTRNASITDIQKCIQILQCIQLPNRIPIQCALVTAFGLSSQLTNAMATFNAVPNHELNSSLVCALMTAHLHNEQYDKALSVYKEYNTLHDEVSHILGIKAASKLNDFAFAQHIIDSVHFTSYNAKQRSLYNAIIGFYGRVGDIESASRLFELIPVDKRDVIHVTMMMNALCINGMNWECIHLFEHTFFNHKRRPKSASVQPNDITFSVALKACIHETALSVGMRIHEYLKMNQHFALRNLDVQCKLLSLCGKAGRLDLCVDIFEEIKDKQRDTYMNQIKIWNRMINAYGRNSQIHNIIEMLDTMQRETELVPNEYTIIHLLNVKGVDMNTIKHILDTYIFKEATYEPCFDINDSMNHMSRKQLLDTLNLFILCASINRKLCSSNEYDVDFDKQLCSFPAFQLKHGIAIHFKQILFSVITNEDTWTKQCLYQLIGALYSRSDASLHMKEYLSVLDAYGLMDCTTEMMQTYGKMLSSEIALNKEILICVLHHLIRHGEPQHMDRIWNDIINDKNVRLNSATFQALILCVNKTRDTLPNDTLRKMWDLVVDQQNIKLNLHCYCLALLSFSQYADDDNRDMAQTLLSQLESNEQFQTLLLTNDLQFIQILNTYGNLNQLDKMWSFYQEAVRRNHNKHNMDALVLIASQERMPRALIHTVCDMVQQHFDIDADLSIDHLINLHRIAVKYGDVVLQNKVWMVLQDMDKKHKIKQNIWSYFTLNGESCSIASGYEKGGCPFDSHRKLSRLMKATGYKINTSICPELPSEIARQRHLQSHSEKKALAILLSADRCTENIKIKVKKKMCDDCHAFFCRVSKTYNQYNIECVDPKGIHRFKNGVCYLCHSSG